MKIICHYSNNPPFRPIDYIMKGLGGTESYAINISKQFAKLGNEVKFYNMSVEDYETIDGVYWSNISEFNSSENADILISFRMREIFHRMLGDIKHKVLILADTESKGLGDDVRAGLIDSVVAVSKWQMDKISKEEGLEDHPCWILSSNCIDTSEFDLNRFQRRNEFPLCIHMSTPERGLGILLELWPRIFERAKLYGITPGLALFSSFYGWGVSEEQNAEMCKDSYRIAKILESDGYRVENRIHANSEVMRMAEEQASFLLYPTNFDETYCISLTECMYAGAIPIVSNRGALAERVRNFVTGFKVGDYESDINEERRKEEFIDATVFAMSLPEMNLYKIRDNAKDYAKTHDYKTVAKRLIDELENKF